MPHLRKILAFLILVFAVGACQRQSRIEGIFGLVENQPDSALQVLNGIDRSTLNDNELAEWALAYCWALDRSGVDVASDSMLRIAYDHYSRRPDAPHYARTEKLPDENPTIGILLCAAKNDTAVKMALPLDNKTILASKYELYLPTTEELRREIEEVKQLAKKK